MIVDALDPNVEPCRANEFTFAVSRGLGIARALKVDADLLRN